MSASCYADLFFSTLEHEEGRNYLLNHSQNTPIETKKVEPIDST